MKTPAVLVTFIVTNAFRNINVVKYMRAKGIFCSGCTWQTRRAHRSAHVLKWPTAALKTIFGLSKVKKRPHSPLRGTVGGVMA